MPSVKDKRKTLRDFPEGPRPLAVGALETSLPCGSFSLIQPPFGGRIKATRFARGCLLLWGGLTFILLALFVMLSCNALDTEVESDKGELDVVSELLVAPLIFAPTKDRFEVNAVVADGDPKTLRLFVLRSLDKGWTEVETVRYPAFDIVEWSVTDLSPGTVYSYTIVTEEDAQKALEEVTAEPRPREVKELDAIKHPRLLFLGEAVTQREPGERFSFALIADTHLRPHEVTPGLDIWAVEEQTLLSVVQDIKVNHPDFIVHLGDVLDFHDYGFNDPPPSGDVTRWGYLNYRRMLADIIGNTAHFMVIGNWEGENGDYDEDEIDRSREQRLLYAPGPEPGTYPQGGSPNEDYYAFTWGDALFIVLNVMTYTPTSHRLGSYPGLVDDWTLGEEQMAWFEETLADATAKWRFVLIHHTVGGAAGDLYNSAYGRGGGQAANVGEQAKVHALMIEHGVQIFFYGHDHVFTDMVVDGIHYTLPGSAGATWKFGTGETGYTEYRPESGHGLVTVTPQNVLVEFIAEGGEVIDRYTVE
jgi:3',5'-cyclic AMP phosphodiesterase CpdA